MLFFLFFLHQCHWGNSCTTVIEKMLHYYNYRLSTQQENIILKCLHKSGPNWFHYRIFISFVSVQSLWECDYALIAKINDIKDLEYSLMVYNVHNKTVKPALLPLPPLSSQMQSLTCFLISWTPSDVPGLIILLDWHDNVKQRLGETKAGIGHAWSALLLGTP